MAIVLDGTNGISSSGAIIVPVGSSSAPAVVPSGDGNTGITFPSADTIAIVTGGLERIKTDSNGFVTRPYQPYFLGYPTTDYSSGGMPTGNIAFTASYNNGNCFNTSNSRFTAPISGWYRTTWGGLQLPSTVTSLYLNGSSVHNGNHYAGTSVPQYITMTQTAIRYLNAGDYLTIYGWNGGGYYAGWYVWSVEMVG